jgi:hypothetical protein
VVLSSSHALPFLLTTDYTDCTAWESGLFQPIRIPRRRARGKGNHSAVGKFRRHRRGGKPFMTLIQRAMQRYIRVK